MPLRLMWDHRLHAKTLIPQTAVVSAHISDHIDGMDPRLKNRDFLTHVEVRGDHSFRIFVKMHKKREQSTESHKFRNHPQRQIPVAVGRPEVLDEVFTPFSAIHFCADGIYHSPEVVRSETGIVADFEISERSVLHGKLGDEQSLERIFKTLNGIKDETPESSVKGVSSVNSLQCRSGFEIICSGLPKRIKICGKAIVTDRF